MRKIMPGLLIIVIFVLLVAGCQSDKKEDADNARKTDITVSLYWWPIVEFTPIYAAFKEGYFEDEHLNVTLIHSSYDSEGNPVNVVPQVLNGNLDFGMVGSDLILEAQANGEPLVGVATLYQRFPTGLASLESSGIDTPDDLPGKRIILWSEDSSYLMFLHQTGLNREDMIEVTDDQLEGGYNLQHLLDGSGDAIIMFVPSDLPELQRLAPNETFNTMLFFDYGVGGYPDVFFTTQAMVDERPEVVQAFVNALVKGLKYAVGNPETMVDDYLANWADENNTLDRDTLLQIMVASLPLFNPAGSQPAMMEASVWETQSTTFQEMGRLPAGLDWQKAINLRFVEAAQR